MVSIQDYGHGECASLPGVIIDDLVQIRMEKCVTVLINKLEKETVMLRSIKIASAAFAMCTNILANGLSRRMQNSKRACT